MKSISNLFLSLLFLQNILAQPSELGENISAIVFLDSFVVTASKKGFDVADFIDIVQKDESFFLAFHNLRFQAHQADNRVEIFNNKQKLKAANYHLTEQRVKNNCRSMIYLQEDIKGKFYKNRSKRKHKYYTAKMHDQVFLTRGKICGEPEQPSISSENLSGIQKHINELKKLIFQPGKRVEVPLIGGKTAIFEPEMIKYYDFYILSKNFNDTQPCYVFRAVAKPAYRANKTIIKYLETYFDQNNFQVLARNYHLKYDGLFDFDVKMKVALTQLGDKYLPATIEYDGQWKIPFQKREIVEFGIDFKYD